MNDLVDTSRLLSEIRREARALAEVEAQAVREERRAYWWGIGVAIAMSLAMLGLALAS